MQALLNHYKELTGVRPNLHMLDLAGMYDQPPDLSLLDSPFSEREVREAVNNLPLNKSSGPDGLPNEFLKHSWDSLKPCIVNLLHSLYHENTDLSQMNKARIVLVPKIDTPTRVTDYRPISVINLIPKLFSKILASRLKPHIADLISEHQTAFIHERFIAENFLATREVLHHVNLSNSPALLLKLYFAKAFDTLDWAFLTNVLRTRGFPGKYIRWIFHLLTTSSSSIAINGQLSDSFTHKRGLRQGDPLSPYLFILAADVLHRMMTRISSVLPQQLTTKLRHPILTFQYADDTVFILSATGTTIRALLLAIHSFSASSGLKVNFAKSAFVPLSLSDAQVHRIERLLGCPSQSLPLTYLGMPLTLKSPRRVDFLPLLQKLERKLEGWRARFLSRAGKLQLVKSVLSTIPTYYMSCFKFPKWLIDRIDTIRRQFLWSRPQPTNGIHLINWRTVCLPLKCGGLGVPDLQLQNIALLLRWWWRIFSPDQKLWRSYVSLIYARTNSAPLILTKKGSFFWQSIHSLRPLFHSCSQFQIRSGEHISFWFDGWDGQPLSYTTSGYLAHKEISLLEAKTCSHPLLPLPLTLGQHNSLQKLRNFIPQPDQDSLLWTISPSSVFSVRSVYKILSQGGKTTSLVASLWRAKVTPSMKCFFFLFLNNRLLTHDIMLRRNLQHAPGCVLCSQCPAETAIHLFFQCPFARLLWLNLSTHLGYRILHLADSLLQTFILSQPADKNKLKTWTTLFITATWILWKERNERTFRSSGATVTVLTARIIQEAELCSKYY